MVPFPGVWAGCLAFLCPGCGLGFFVVACCPCMLGPLCNVCFPPLLMGGKVFVVFFFPGCPDSGGACPAGVRFMLVLDSG